MGSDQAYMLDIVQAARLALEYVQDVSREEFLCDVRLQDSVIRRIEIIGEAARRVSSATQEAHPDITWAEMIGMRNFLIHDYGAVDMEVVWDTVQHNLPDLIAQLEPIVPGETT